MTALRPCPSGITAPPSSNLGLSSCPTRSMLPLGRRKHNTMFMPLEMYAGNYSHRIQVHNGPANQPVNPDPEEDTARQLRGASPNPLQSADFKKNWEEIQEKWEKIKKIDKGPPDMPFREEVDRIDEYLKKNCHTSILHLEGTALSISLCTRARNAATLASKVMECAALRPDTPGKISVHTIKQAAKMYVCIFVSTAEDSYRKKVTKDTIVSFLGALQGVASLSHILLQDTLAKRTLIDNKDSPSNYGSYCDVDRARLEYHEKMNDFKHEFMKAQPVDAYKLLRPTMTDASTLTDRYVIHMNAKHKQALGIVLGRTRKPDDGESHK